MLTIREEIELHRLRDHVAACLLGQCIAGALALVCLLIVWVHGLTAFRTLALFEAFVAMLFVALGRRLQRRVRALEELAPE